MVIVEPFIVIVESRLIVGPRCDEELGVPWLFTPFPHLDKKKIPCKLSVYKGFSVVDTGIEPVCQD